MSTTVKEMNNTSNNYNHQKLIYKIPKWANEEEEKKQPEFKFTMIPIETVTLDSKVFSYVPKGQEKFEAMSWMKRIIEKDNVKNFEILDNYSDIEEFDTRDFPHKSFLYWDDWTKRNNAKIGSIEQYLMFLAYCMNTLILKAGWTPEKAWDVFFDDTESVFGESHKERFELEKMIGVKNIVSIFDRFLASDDPDDNGFYSADGGCNYEDEKYPVGAYFYEEKKDIGGHRQFRIAWIVR